MKGELGDLFAKQTELSGLRKRVSELEEEIECAIAGVLSRNVKEDDEYKLTETERKKNEIVPAFFKKCYPEIYEDVISITKRDAEKRLKQIHPGEKYIDKYLKPVTVQVGLTISYKVEKKIV